MTFRLIGRSSTREPPAGHRRRSVAAHLRRDHCRVRADRCDAGRRAAAARCPGPRLEKETEPAPFVRMRGLVWTASAAPRADGDARAAGSRAPTADWMRHASGSVPPATSPGRRRSPDLATPRALDSAHGDLLGSAAVHRSRQIVARRRLNASSASPRSTNVTASIVVSPTKWRGPCAARRGRGVDGETEGASADRRGSDGPRAQLVGGPQHVAVGAREQVQLVLTALAPHRADRMDHPARGQLVCLRPNGRAGRCARGIAPAHLARELRSGRPGGSPHRRPRRGRRRCSRR